MKRTNRIKRLLGVAEKKKAPAEMQTVNKGEDSQKLSYFNCTIDKLKSQVEKFYRYVIRRYGGDKNDG